jgi:hypothetical protein
MVGNKLKPRIEHRYNYNPYILKGIQLFQLRLSPSKAEKSNTSAKECWESLIKQPFALVFDFPALLVDNLNLIEVAVCADNGFMRL